MYKHGIISKAKLGDELPITIKSYSTAKSGEIAEVRNETGKIVKRGVYSQKSTVSIDGVVEFLTAETDAEKIVEVGDYLTIDAVKHLIESVDIKEEQTDYVQISITATYCDEEETE